MKIRLTARPFHTPPCKGWGAQGDGSTYWRGAVIRPTVTGVDLSWRHWTYHHQQHSPGNLELEPYCAGTVRSSFDLQLLFHHRDFVLMISPIRSQWWTVYRTMDITPSTKLTFTASMLYFTRCPHLRSTFRNGVRSMMFSLSGPITIIFYHRLLFVSPRTACSTRADAQNLPSAL